MDLPHDQVELPLPRPVAPKLPVNVSRVRLRPANRDGGGGGNSAGSSAVSSSPSGNGEDRPAARARRPCLSALRSQEIVLLIPALSFVTQHLDDPVPITDTTALSLDLVRLHLDAE